MTAYNAKNPYEPDWQIPRGVWANVKTGSYVLHKDNTKEYHSDN